MNSDIKVLDYKYRNNRKEGSYHKNKRGRGLKKNTKIEKERVNVYWKMKRSPDERHTLTCGGLTEMFWQSQMSFSIRRE